MSFISCIHIFFVSQKIIKVSQLVPKYSSDGAVRENRETGPDRPGFETGPDRIFTHKKVVEQEYKYIY